MADDYTIRLGVRGAKQDVIRFLDFLSYRAVLPAVEAGGEPDWYAALLTGDWCDQDFDLIYGLSEEFEALGNSDTVQFVSGLVLSRSLCEHLNTTEFIKSLFSPVPELEICVEGYNHGGIFDPSAFRSIYYAPSGTEEPFYHFIQIGFNPENPADADFFDYDWDYDDRTPEAFDSSGNVLYALVLEQYIKKFEKDKQYFDSLLGEFSSDFDAESPILQDFANRLHP